MKHKLKLGDKLYYLKSERDYKAELGQTGLAKQRIYKKSIDHVVIDKVGRDYAYAKYSSYKEEKISLETLKAQGFNYVKQFHLAPQEVNQEQERQQILIKLSEFFRYGTPRNVEYTKLKAIANILEIEVTPVKYEEQ